MGSGGEGRRGGAAGRGRRSAAPAAHPRLPQDVVTVHLRTPGRRVAYDTARSAREGKGAGVGEAAGRGGEGGGGGGEGGRNPMDTDAS